MVLTTKHYWSSLYTFFCHKFDDLMKRTVSLSHQCLWCDHRSGKHLVSQRPCSTLNLRSVPDNTDTAPPQSHSLQQRGQTLALKCESHETKSKHECLPHAQTFRKMYVKCWQKGISMRLLHNRTTTRKFPFKQPFVVWFTL